MSLYHILALFAPSGPQSLEVLKTAWETPEVMAGSDQDYECSLPVGRRTYPHVYDCRPHQVAASLV